MLLAGGGRICYLESTPFIRTGTSRMLYICVTFFLAMFVFLFLFFDVEKLGGFVLVMV